MALHERVDPARDPFGALPTLHVSRHAQPAATHRTAEPKPTPLFFGVDLRVHRADPFGERDAVAPGEGVGLTLGVASLHDEFVGTQLVLASLMGASLANADNFPSPSWMGWSVTPPPRFTRVPA
jgi:hypothetical protein